MCGDFSEFGSSTPGLSFYCRSGIEGEECQRLSNKKGYRFAIFVTRVR